MSNTHVLELEKHSGSVAVTWLVGCLSSKHKDLTNNSQHPKPYVHISYVHVS